MLEEIFSHAGYTLMFLLWLMLSMITVSGILLLDDHRNNERTSY
jgi:hypothetical protein